MEDSGVIVEISSGSDDEDSSSSSTSFAVSRPCPRSKKKKKSITENGYYLIVKQSEGTDDEAVPCPRSKKQKVYDVNENVIELSDEDEEAIQNKTRCVAVDANSLWISSSAQMHPRRRDQQV